MNVSNPSAFPQPIHTYENTTYQGADMLGEEEPQGMTLRDYFAAKALGSGAFMDEMCGGEVENVARWCYQFADAMLKERARGTSVEGERRDV